MITSQELRSKYTAFFVERGHAVIPSASLVPANDPTVLFTTAGMHPLVPYLLGAPHPAGARLVNVQKCIRTGDIEVIGDDTHLTLFEMLGNWSLGDYFRDDAIRWSFELLSDPRWLGLPVDRLGVSCFAGDDEVGRDDDSARIWRALGIPAERIAWLGRDDNWWGPAGNTGPCGPDTEIFYWTGRDRPPRAFDPRDRRWVEIWNNVFMGYTRTASAAIEPLPRSNVDTGMGLERMLVALNGLDSVYDVDTVAPLFGELAAMAPAGEAHRHELRVIADHVRAACFLISDGVGPSNKDRGYVVRRLLRRCLWLARRLAMPADWYRRAIARVVDTMAASYPELAAQREVSVRAIADELSKFERAVALGERALRSITKLDGKRAFDLFQTHGIPLDLTLELAEARGLEIVRDDFDAARDDHRALSRTTSSGSFAGGLADHSAEIVRYHTITHLLLAALRAVLGGHVIQRGSNITRERLRFDFSHDTRLTDPELERVEATVNGWLAHELVVEHATMPRADAFALGALGAFGERYGDIVSVYAIHDRHGGVISRELCGGPHVQSLGAGLTGRFRILREQAASAGVRRIKAIVTPD
jgi:alanyl-tRNA synthetase